MNVANSPVKLEDYPLIQNLGPDPIYIGVDNSVTSETGVKIDTGQSFTSKRSNSWVVSSGTSDVRTVEQGIGVYSNMEVAES